MNILCRKHAVIDILFLQTLMVVTSNGSRCEPHKFDLNSNRICQSFLKHSSKTNNNFELLIYSTYLWTAPLHRIKLNRGSHQTEPWKFVSPRMSHYACSLCMFWPVRWIFWPIETLGSSATILASQLRKNRGTCCTEE